MLVFGLTGGLASGKSAVGRMLREREIPVIDADLLAREVVLPGSPGLAEVVRQFGPSVLLPDGSLDRSRVADLVFADPEKRKTLNRIVHPRIAALTAERIADLQNKGTPLVCYEAALLVENGLADAFRPLIVVSVSEQTQVERAMVRDKSTEEQARARIASQHSLAAKVAVADIVIDNSGDLAATEKQVEAALVKIRAYRRA